MCSSDLGGGTRGTQGLYNNNGTVGSALISVDPQTHNLVVIADAQTALQISNVIRNLDSAKPQVLIKVVFMEVQRNNGSELGVEGAWAKNNIGNNVSSGGGTVLGLSGVNGVTTNLNGLGQSMGTALTPSSTGTGAGGLYQIAGSEFQATLRAVATSGKAQVLSRPSIIARDGQLARIVVGQQVPLPSGVSYATSGGNTKGVYRAADLDSERGVPVKMATPDVLGTAMEDLTGYSWDREDHPVLLTDRLGVRGLGGGVDGMQVKRAATEPGATVLLVQKALATEAAAWAVEQEQAMSADDRRLFTEIDFTETADDRAVRLQLEIGRAHV